jgi:hypothetical protein
VLEIDDFMYSLVFAGAAVEDGHERWHPGKVTLAAALLSIS